MSKRLLRTEPAAEYLGLKPATLIGWRHKGVGPRYSKMGKIAVYDQPDLDAFVDQCAVKPGHEDFLHDGGCVSHMMQTQIEAGLWGQDRPRKCNLLGSSCNFR